MADKPIIFSAPMIRALLEDRKVQTRRVISERNTMFNGDRWPNGLKLSDCDTSAAFVDPGPSPSGNSGPYLKVMWPYGRMFSGVPGDDEMLMARLYPSICVGDRLWVKERCAIVPASAYRMSEGVQQTIDPDDPYNAAVYFADWDRSMIRFRSSLHMPKWASRLTLIVSDVRVERLKDITEADAVAEGWPPTNERDPYAATSPLADPKVWYGWLWNSINGPGSWESNPWVVAYTFSVIPRNIDEVS